MILEQANPIGTQTWLVL